MIEFKSEREKLIYLAAIIDGEGSIGIELSSPCKVKREGKEVWQRKKYYYICRVCVINTNLEWLEWIKENFDGGIVTHNKACENRKLCHRWQIFGTNQRILLEKIIPFLFIKRKQAELVLELRNIVGETGRLITDEILEQRKQLWLKCKELNKLG
jgi:hypothetical protein